MNANFHFRPDTWDHIIFNCVNQHNEYRLPSSFKPEDIIIDIGSHIGSFAYACLTRGAGKVYAFEAMPDNYKMAVNNLAQFEDKVSVQHAAVWRSDKQVDKLCFSKSTDTKNTGGGNVWSGEGESVPAISFDNVLESIGQPIKLLKLDCEGSEFPILFTSKKLDMVESICGEYHEFGGYYDQNTIAESFQVGNYTKYTIEELFSFLKGQGFDVVFTRSLQQDGTPCNLGLFFATRNLLV
jgi:FkbM family methyltransferase